MPNPVQALVVGAGISGLVWGGWTSAGRPTPSASLIRSSVPTLGLASPFSTLMTILRLTPEASASWSNVQPRACRSVRTRAPKRRS